jgi:Tfp pilus assembly protein PilO
VTMNRLNELLHKPFAPLLPWLGLVLSLLWLLLWVHEAGVVAAEMERVRLEQAWVSARQMLAHHREAKQAMKDLNQVWAVLPAERDFAPLALGISEEAKRDKVSLPALSYKTEPTSVPRTSKGLLQGSMTGRYEDLRRFIYDLETAEELLFIEDLELSKGGGQQDQTLTFNIKIATYLRSDGAKPVAQEPGS